MPDFYVYTVEEKKTGKVMQNLTTGKRLYLLEGAAVNYCLKLSRPYQYLAQDIPYHVVRYELKEVPYD